MNPEAIENEKILAEHRAHDENFARDEKERFQNMTLKELETEVGEVGEVYSRALKQLNLLIIELRRRESEGK